MKQSAVYDGDIITKSGMRFRVNFEHDEYCDPPWQNDDSCGPVRQSNHRHGPDSTDKRPGERPLNSPDRREYQYYYDWRAACIQARRDGWNAAPYDAPHRIQRAVQHNFDFIRQWLANDWVYLVVTVRRVDVHDNPIGDSDSCGMVESFEDYHMDKAHEMIGEMVASIRRASAKKGSKQNSVTIGRRVTL